jgi:transcriptional regulator with PAS, ATPase and Fis domain
LSVIPIEIKPLRERPEDILPLVYHVLHRELGANKELPHIEPDVLAIFEQYSWPGNVRELENALKHALTFAKNNVLTKECLPVKIIHSPGSSGSDVRRENYRGKSLKAFLRMKEKEYLADVLKDSEGDKQKAAKSLRISLATLYRKLPEQTE